MRVALTYLVLHGGAGQKDSEGGAQTDGLHGLRGGGGRIAQDMRLVHHHMGPLDGRKHLLLASVSPHSLEGSDDHLVPITSNFLYIGSGQVSGGDQVRAQQGRKELLHLRDPVGGQSGRTDHQGPALWDMRLALLEHRHRDGTQRLQTGQTDKPNHLFINAML